MEVNVGCPRVVEILRFLVADRKCSVLEGDGIKKLKLVSMTTDKLESDTVHNIKHPKLKPL